MTKAKSSSSRRTAHRYFGLRLGLLGGGQLARMLALKAHEMGLETRVLCPSESEPAAQVAGSWERGSPDSEADLRRFAKTVDILTIESEFHSGELLRRVVDRTSTPLFPAPESVSLWQDRASQKEALVKAGVPTAPFQVVRSAQQAEDFFHRQAKGAVFKKRHGGYDGYGTFVARSVAELKKHLRNLDFRDGGFIAEAFIPFRRELAVVFARNPSGQIVRLPLVQTHQEDHRLDWLVGPVHHRGLDRLERRLRLLLKKIDYVGAIAFELFDTGSELLVNEVAPRVHNSAHYSLEALTLDQFSLHLRAILDEALEAPQVLTKSFAMVNLIGAGADKPAAPTVRRGHLHWYGKSDCRAGRKMGHLTWVGRDAAQGLKTLIKERKGFRL